MLVRASPPTPKLISPPGFRGERVKPICAPFFSPWTTPAITSGNSCPSVGSSARGRPNELLAARTETASSPCFLVRVLDRSRARDVGAGAGRWLAHVAAAARARKRERRNAERDYQRNDCRRRAD